MTMYAEERQQAIARLVTQRGRMSVNQLAQRVRRHHRDRAPRSLHARAPRAGAPRPRGRRTSELAVAHRVRHPRARPGQHRDQGAHRPRCPRPAPPRRRHDPARRGIHDRAARHPAPSRTASSPSSPTRSRSPRAWPGCPTSTCDCSRAASARPPRPRSGADTVEALSHLRVDVAFLGTNGITADHGLTTPDPDEAAVKRAIVACGRLVVALADASKFGVETAVRFASPDDVDVRDHRRRRPGRRASSPHQGRHRGRGRMTAARRGDTP